MDNILPIFSTHASLGSAILTSEYADGDKDRDELKDTAPISVITIAKRYDVKNTFICDSSISLFIQCYENFKKIGRNFTWGLRLNICNDANQKTEESIKTESKVIIWMNNSDAYKDIIKIYTKAHTKDNYYIPRTDWPSLNKLWTKNLSLSIPFYGGFFHRNMLMGYCSLPEFGSIEPSFQINKMGLPFDDILENYIVPYAKDNRFEIINTHPVYYYKKKDFDAMTVFKCINKRNKFDCPNIDYWSSDNFCYESYLEKTGGKLL